MIQSNELRIGNLVDWDRSIGNLPNEIVEIYNITRSTVRCYTKIPELYEILAGLYEIKPIPLTEEWLKKFGFYKNKDHVKHGNGMDFKPDYPRTTYTCYNTEVADDCYFAIIYSKDEYYIEGDLKSESYSSIVFGDFYPDQPDSSNFIHTINNIQYVHQLQNLYFALTGKELELK